MEIISPPFRGDLVKGSFCNRSAIFDISDYKHWVVRDEKRSFGTTEEAIKFYREHNDLLSQISSHGINIPRFMIVLSEKPEETGIGAYTVVERVKGNHLEDINPSKFTRSKRDLFDTAINQTYSGIVTYWFDCWKNGTRNVNFDIYGPDQYMYGRTKEDQEDKLYLLDIESVGGKTTIYHYLMWLGALPYHLIGREFNKTRQQLECFLNDIEQLEPNNSDIEMGIDNVRRKLSL